MTMNRYHKFIQICVFVIILSFAFNHYYNPFLDTTAFPVIKINEEDELYKKIQEISEEFNEQPQDAYIDRVWKKTPGRSGIEVNVAESYKKMKKAGNFDESFITYDYVSPEIQLSDLPAAPIYRGHPEKEMVALLINVSWGTEHIPDILNVLKEHHVKATFFIEGKWAKENPNVVKMIDEQNHVIGNHAYNHPDMARMSKQQIHEQINETNNVIKAIIGKTPRWFAPPSGSFNDQVVQTAHDLKMLTILWTVDTIDWKKPSVDVMLNRVLTKIHPGATILMHPTVPVVNGLSEMITGIKKQGYKIGTIEQLLSEDRE